MTTSTRTPWFLVAIGASTALLAWTSFLDPKKPWPINLGLVCLGVFVVGVPVIAAAVATRESRETRLTEDAEGQMGAVGWAFAYVFEIGVFLFVLLSVLSN